MALAVQVLRPKARLAVVVGGRFEVVAVQHQVVLAILAAQAVLALLVPVACLEEAGPHSVEPASSLAVVPWPVRVVAP